MIAHLKSLFTYEDWANQQTLASLLRAEQPPERAVEVMGHLIGAQQVWLARVRGSETPAAVWPALSLADCGKQLPSLGAAWSELLASFSEEDLPREVHYKTSKGDSWTTRVDEILFHLLLHGSYHRGQIATLLGRHGDQPASTDLIIGLRAGAVGFDGA